MFTIFQEEPWITVIMLFFFGISVITRLTLGIFYENMIRGTENMAVTKNVYLKQCKTKFIKCHQLNGGVSNVPVYVEKFISRLTMGPFSFDGWYHLSGQTMLLSIVAAGVGICKCIALEKNMGGIIPFYLVCFAELYGYFSLSAALDIKGKRTLLKINLVDYLENHLSARIGTTQQDLEMLHYAKPGEKVTEYMPTGKRMEMVEAADPCGKAMESAEKMREAEAGDQQEGEKFLNAGSKAEQETWDALLQEILTY